MESNAKPHITRIARDGKEFDLILTDGDWPIMKTIEANYRGMTSDELFAQACQMFHIMMEYVNKPFGGYCVGYHYNKIAEELEFRNDFRLKGYTFSEASPPR